MVGESGLSFDELVEHRRGLQEFCDGQYDGIAAFKDGYSFKVYLNEGVLDCDLAHHLSSTATCYESLLDCPAKFVPESGCDVSKDAVSFTALALKRAADNWTSDGSAPIYCRCRTLPLVIKFTEVNVGELEKHLNKILEQLKDSGRIGVGRA